MRSASNTITSTLIALALSTPVVLAIPGCAGDQSVPKEHYYTPEPIPEDSYSYTGPQATVVFNLQELPEFEDTSSTDILRGAHSVCETLTYGKPVSIHKVEERFAEAAPNVGSTSFPTPDELQPQDSITGSQVLYMRRYLEEVLEYTPEQINLTVMSATMNLCEETIDRLDDEASVLPPFPDIIEYRNSQ
ncbi:hypothetical protein QDX21_07125 [Auritidibacter ignavus]|uniref:Uncharacterized protein n=1 Tax=Auritidibacter ignavus TaxID=678932 RepID=A0AAJ6AG58_9MICC|nr:hypothetical protein [Auritidibacter ignavus]WGH92107.1 hypothetical protein QDX21_07125 [Auritidibacter ignavus]